jgi:hypothetical protein
MSEVWLSNYLKAFPSACPLCRRPLVPERAACGYCGSRLRLGLKAIEPYLIAWGLTLGGAAVTAGFGMFLLLLMLMRMPSASNWVMMTYFGMGVLGLIMAGVSVLLLVLRRAFVRLPRVVQWGIALVCWGIAMTTAVLFALIIR